MEHPPAWARPLAWCLHALGLLLCIAPLLDLAAGVGSINPEQVPWRFGAFGLLSGALVLPMVGLGLILVASVLLEQVGLTRAVGVLAALGLVAILAVLVVFALDALQVRAQIRQEAKRPFDLATVKALATYGMESLVALTVAIQSFKLARTATAGRRTRKSASPLVVSQGEG